MVDNDSEMRNEAGYTYYAFVSHSHRDAKWATWIQDALERYRLPNSVRKAVRKPLPKRLAPVFRDATDLGSCQLVEGLHRELEASRFLIVICSPDSAKPNAEGKHFVDHEVDYFAGLGRADRIIPVIVSGTPEESFGPKIRELDLLALDATKASRARVLNDIVAKILGLRPDELWRRERRRQLIRRIMLCAAGVCAALLLVGGGLFAWDSTRQVVRYYADYVEAYGLPQGLFPLSPTDIPGRSVSYRFEYRGVHFGKCVHKDTSGPSFVGLFGFRRVLRRVVQEDSYGRPVDRESSTPEERPQILRFTEYAADGTLREARQEKYVCAGVEPRLVRRLVFKDEDGVVNGLVKFVDRQSRTVVFSPATMTDELKALFSSGVRSEIAQQVFARDGAGYVTSVSFLDVLGGSATDVDGLGGFRFERDELGRIIRKVYLDAKGEPRAVKNGVAARSYDYAKGKSFTVIYEGLDGRPILNAENWARRCDELDRHGNVLKRSYFDEAGRLTFTKLGYAECRRSHDERGNLVKECYFDEEGIPCLNSNGISGYAAKFSQDGRSTEFLYFGTDGKPCLNSCELQKMSAQKLVEAVGKPIPWIGGVAGWTMEWDWRGLCLAMTSLGTCGERIENTVGFAELRLDYDAFGNPVKMCWYDDFCKYMLGRRFEYDGRGRMTREESIGVDGRKKPTADNVAMTEYKYDLHGNQSAMRFCGVDGRLCCLSNDVPLVAGVECEYDKRGRRIRMLCIGVDGKPVLAKHKAFDFAEKRTEYDDIRRCEKERYYGANGEPHLRDGCYFGMDTEYDELGRESKWAWIGVDGRPTTNKYGFAECRMKYDVRGNISESLHYDVNGRLSTVFLGVACFKTDYDKHGRKTRFATYGVDGRPNAPSAEHNVAASTVEYDKRGNCTAELYFDVNEKPTLSGKGYAAKRSQYDVRGNCTSVRYSGVDGKLCLCNDGHAGWDAAFDDSSREVRHVWIGVDGKPMCGKDGFAEWRKEYDAYGNQTSLRYYGADGMLCLQGDENAGWNAEYDRRGREVRRVWIGVDGKPMCVKAGYAEMCKEYNSQGECTATRYYGADGNPPRWKSEYDNSGREIRRVWLDVEGKPMADADGVFEYRKTYDENGNCTAVRYYGAEGKLLTEGGIFGWDSEYDSQRREVRRVWVGPGGLRSAVGVCYADNSLQVGKCTMKVWHDSEESSTHHFSEDHECAEWRRTYAEDGKCTSIGFYDRVGHLIYTAEYDGQGRLTRFDGGLRYRKTYDAQGNCVSLRYHGKDGELKSDWSSGIAGWNSEFDSRGHEIRHVWIGVDGRPTTVADGTSGWCSEYDDQNREVRRIWLGADEKPMFVKVGYVEWRKTFDVRGNCTGIRYYGIDGRPCLLTGVNAGWDAEYDDQRRLVRYVNMGVDGKPMRDETFGYAEYRKRYNGRGDCVDIRFYGVDGKPCRNVLGFAGSVSEYDSRHRETRKTVVDVDGRAVSCGGVWNLVCAFFRVDSAHEKATRCGAPSDAGNLGGALDGFGCAVYQREYDERGNCTRTRCCDAHGKLVHNWSIWLGLCFAECRKEFDDRGNCTHECYLDADGKRIRPLISKFWYGFAECRREFDKRGNCLCVSYTDADKKLVFVDEVGFAECRKEFDDRGNCTGEWYVGTDGKPCRFDNCDYARVITSYDSLDRLMRRRWFGVDGKPCSGEPSGWPSKICELRIEYDENGGGKVHFYNDGGEEMKEEWAWGGLRNWVQQELQQPCRSK